MRPFDWHWIKGVPRLLATARPEPVQQAERIVAMQLHVVLPAKIAVAAFALYYLFSGSFPGEHSVYVVVLEALQKYILIYILCNLVAGVVFFLWRRLPAGLLQWLVFTLGLLDGLFMAGLTFMTGGFESMAYWMFAGLIVLNAVSIPLAVPQIVLNLLLSVFYLGAGLLDAKVPLPVLWAPPPSAFRSPVGPRTEGRGNSTNEAPLVQDTNRLARTNRPARSPVSDLPYSKPAEGNAVEPFLPRLFVLWLLTACCYGVQVLAERQRHLRPATRMRLFACAPQTDQVAPTYSPINDKPRDRWGGERTLVPLRPRCLHLRQPRAAHPTAIKTLGSRPA